MEDKFVTTLYDCFVIVMIHESFQTNFLIYLQAEILQLLKIDNDSRNPFPAQKNIIQPEPDPLPTPKPAPNVSENPIVQPLPPVSEIPKEKDPPPNIPPPKVSVKTDPLLPKKGEESLVPSSPDVSVSESDGELFESYGAPHNRCFPWGTRVIRGENWKWPDDQNMPGTVVAHKSEGRLASLSIRVSFCFLKIL